MKELDPSCIVASLIILCITRYDAGLYKDVYRQVIFQNKSRSRNLVLLVLIIYIIVMSLQDIAYWISRFEIFGIETVNILCIRI